jgi:membrane associated rhomboid family serine protease
MFCACNLIAIRVAKTTLPRNWFAAFGGRSALPVMLTEALLTALVLAGIAALWGYFTLRPSRRRHKPYIAWLLSGIIVAWAGWLIYGAFYFALNPKNYSQPLQSLLLNSAAAPLFGIFNIFAVLAGAYLAGRLAKRRQLQLPATRSRRRPSPGKPADTDIDDAADSTLTPSVPTQPH